MPESVPVWTLVPFPLLLLAIALFPLALPEWWESHRHKGLVAGLLTPLGDPPLFLGFLHGVPFLWTLSLWGPWLVVNGLLLVAFNLLDRRILEREEKEYPEPLLEEVLEHAPLRVEGKRNLLLLAGVVLVMLGRGQGWGTGGETWPFGLQEAGMATLALAAISAGAVMMGAMTYIGNGPNFMVKAIAERHGVRMPSFFRYIGWSAAALLPILVVVTFLFFRG